MKDKRYDDVERQYVNNRKLKGIEVVGGCSVPRDRVRVDEWMVVIEHLNKRINKKRVTTLLVEDNL